MTTIAWTLGGTPKPGEPNERASQHVTADAGGHRAGTRTPIAAWLDLVGQWRPVGLDELNDAAALQTRVDRKYVLPATAVAPLFRELDAEIGVLRIGDAAHMGYESTYFDTPDRRCYLDAAQARPNRYKVRTRTYLETDTSVLEVKVRPRNEHTIKERFEALDGDHERLSAVDLDVVASTILDHLPARDPAELSGELQSLGPVLRTAYRRSTMLVQGHGGRDFTLPTRATVDTDVSFSGRDAQWLGAPHLAIVETKTGGLPSPVDRILWRSGHRPTTISKYGVGMALFDQTLPANKWNRVLRRHFGWTPEH